MKKILTSLSIVALTAITTVFALEFIDQAGYEAHLVRRKELFQIAKDKIQQAQKNNDEAVLSEATDLIFSILCLEEPETSIAIVQVYMREYEIPQELLIKALEHSVRTNLSIMAKDELANYTASESIQMLGTFQNHDMLPLVKECLLSREIVKNHALASYINNQGANSIPFLRETITKGKLSERNILLINGHLERIVKKLNDENKTTEAEQIITFIQEMKQKETIKDEGENK